MQTITPTTSSITPTATAASSKATAAVPPAASATTEVTESSKTIISVQGTVLSDLFNAADEFIRQEHLTPYQGVRYSYGSHGYIIENEGSYLDVGKYNNYLFDKAATSLIAQAREKGIELDQKDVVAQLKANNAGIAAMQLDNEDRRSKLGELHSFHYLTWTDIQSLTDIYIAAKENGEDLSNGIRAHNVQLMAGKLGSYRKEQLTPGVYVYNRHLDDTPIPEKTRKLADDISGKLLDSFGFGMDFLKFILDPNSGLAVSAGVGAEATEYAFLEFLSKIIDWQKEGSYYSKSLIVNTLGDNQQKDSY